MPSEPGLVERATTVVVLAQCLCVTACTTEVAIEQGCPKGYRSEEGAPYCVPKEVYFAGGTFTMGRGYCSPKEQHTAEYASGECALEDAPTSITVAPFYLDAVELPQGFNQDPVTSWSTFVDPNDFYSVGAVDVESEDGGLREAQERCAWLGKRPVTEAEWEFAATAGGTRDYPWGDAPPTCALAVFGDCDWAGKAATLPASPEGAYDLAGGLFEIVAPGPAGPAYAGTPVDVGCSPCHDGPCECIRHAARGGGYKSTASALRAAQRALITPGTKDWGGVGVRCARSP